MNGAYAQPLTAPPAFAGRQSRATARSATAPYYHKKQLLTSHSPFEERGISMTCTEEYREHIEYTFHAFCKVVIRNATINAARTRSRKHKREISLEYLTDEKHYPLGTTDEYFQAPEPDEEYILTFAAIRSFSAAVYLRKPVTAGRTGAGNDYLSFSSVFHSTKLADSTGAAAAQRATISEKPYGSSKRKWREWHMRNNRLLPMKQSSKPPAGSRKRWELYCSITAAAYNVPPV